jgi:hypothetical protein
MIVPVQAKEKRWLWYHQASWEEGVCGNPTSVKERSATIVKCVEGDSSRYHDIYTGTTMARPGSGS